MSKRKPPTDPAAAAPRRGRKTAAPGAAAAGSPRATPLRTRAEAAMRKRGAAAAVALADRVRLLHELQVHQVELEMQNEELRRANVELAALHSRYHDLYDSAPVAYFTLDLDRRVAEHNLAAARMTGIDRDRIEGKHLADFMLAESRQAFERMIARALVRDDMVEEALSLRVYGAAPVHVKAQARRVVAADPVQVRVVLVDVSALRAANEELAHALEKFFHYWRP